jgi:hypothetical protein
MSNMEAVKANYKVLAKQLHPDTSTGNHEKFTAMKNEYDHILQVNPPFPIVNINRPTVFTVRTDAPETVTNLTPEELNKRKAEAFFASVRDQYFVTIENIVEEFKERKLTKWWCITQLNKVDDLTVNHFKYLCYLLKIEQVMARNWFTNYIDNKVGYMPNMK